MSTTSEKSTAKDHERRRDDDDDKPAPARTAVIPADHVGTGTGVVTVDADTGAIVKGVEETEAEQKATREQYAKDLEAANKKAQEEAS